MYWPADFNKGIIILVHYTHFDSFFPSVIDHCLQANYALEEELREINERLIDTVVYISDEDVDPTAAAATAKGGDGTIVKCSFSAVALSPNLKSQYASAQMVRF